MSSWSVAATKPWRSVAATKTAAQQEAKACCIVIAKKGLLLRGSDKACCPVSGKKACCPHVSLNTCCSGAARSLAAPWQQHTILLHGSKKSRLMHRKRVCCTVNILSRSGTNKSQLLSGSKKGFLHYSIRQQKACCSAAPSKAQCFAKKGGSDNGLLLSGIKKGLLLSGSQKECCPMVAKSLQHCGSQKAFCPLATKMGELLCGSKKTIHSVATYLLHHDN